MLNKCLRQNWRIFNKIRFTPIGIKPPEDLNHINEWCEKVWNHLCDDELKRHKLYKVDGRKGFTITVWTDNEYVYLVQVVRDENNTDATMIYMQELSENNLNDFLAIAKFIRYNIKGIIGHSQDAVHELNKLVAAQNIQKEIEGKPVDA